MFYSKTVVHKIKITMRIIFRRYRIFSKNSCCIILLKVILDLSFYFSFYLILLINRVKGRMNGLYFGKYFGMLSGVETIRTKYWK